MIKKCSLQFQQDIKHKSYVKQTCEESKEIFNLLRYYLDLPSNTHARSNIKARTYDKHCIFRDKSIQCLRLPLPKIILVCYTCCLTKVASAQIPIENISYPIKMPLTKSQANLKSLKCSLIHKMSASSLLSTKTNLGCVRNSFTC